MSIIIKSNVAYTGDKRLNSVIPDIMTAQQYYDDYAERVIADGGEIINPAKTLGTIEFLFSNGLMSRSNSIVSTYYGVKREGAKVTKLYGLDGQDLVGKIWGTGQYSEIAPDGSLKPFSVNNDRVNGCLYQSKEAVRIAPKSKVAFVSLPILTSTSLPNSSATLIGYADGTLLGQTKHYGALSLNVGKAEISVPAPAATNTVATGTLSTGTIPLIGILDLKQGVRKVIQGQSVIYTNLISIDPALQDTNSYAQFGGVYYDKEGTFNDGSFAMNNLYAGWFVFDFTEPELLLISQHVQQLAS